MHGVREGKSVEIASKPYLFPKDRLVAIHDVDCPWRPADLEQRAGRIVRQGNQNDEVQIFRYATQGTFDVL